MLYWNGPSLIGDTVRTMSAGILRGYKDVDFAPLVSFLLMTVVGIGAGATACFGFHKTAVWLFAIRAITIYIAGFLNYDRSMTVNYQQLLIFNSRPARRAAGYERIPIPVDETTALQNG